MALQLPDGTWLSPDRYWRYAGGRWTPMVPPTTGPPGLFWFLRSPNWFPAILIIGLIALLPVVGFMNLYGWALATAANLRAGYQVAAPATFDYIGRGARYFAWGCVVGLLDFILAAVVAVVTGALVYTAGHDWRWTIAIAAAGGVTVLSVLGLVIAPLAVPVLQLIDHDGFGSALDPRRVAGVTRQNWDAAWYGALANLTWIVLYYAANAAGALVPFVGFVAGFLLTIPAYGALGLMLAAPLARFGDPPQTFDRTNTRWLIAAYVAYTGFIALAAWGIALLVAALTSHSAPQSSA
jgi:hypothetical protein